MVMCFVEFLNPAEEEAEIVFDVSLIASMPCLLKVEIGSSVFNFVLSTAHCSTDEIERTHLSRKSAKRKEHFM
jgi:hypothetical protein